MIKILIRIFQALIVLTIVSFVVSSVLVWNLYRMHPEHYATNSAPWYLPIQIRAVYTGIGLLVFGGILKRLRRKL